MSRNFLKPLAAFVVTAVLAGCASTSTSEGTGEWFDDSMITTKVKSALIGTEGVSSTAINVETFRGVVQLSGFAASQAEVDKAVKAAQGVSGVKSVKNSIQLRAAAR